MSGRRSAVAVGLLAALAFVPALGAGFVADDYVLLRTVDRVQGLGWIFTHNDLGQPAGGGHFYRPLWVALNWAVVSLFGERPGPLHAVNLALFAIVAVEVLVLGRRLLGGEGRALAAAVAFAVFPRHGESVAWVSGNTDLLAVALALGGLLLATRPGARPAQLALGAGLAAAAVASKEAAVVMPVLALGVARVQAGSWVPWRGPALLLAAQVPVLVVRAVVVGGVGGYAGEPFGPGRALGALASYGVASLSPPQLDLLGHPLLLLVALGAAAAVTAGAVAARRTPRLAAVVLLGAAWWLVAVLPVLNLPLDLNTANGSRLLLLPSVGLALLFGAVVPARLPARSATLAVVTGVALCLWTSADWVRAGQIADDFARSGARLAADRSGVVLLSVPIAYRTANLFPDGFDTAIQRAAGREVTVVGCAGVQVRRSAAAVRFTAGEGRLVGSTTSAVPFDVSVFGSGSALSPECAFTADGSGAPPGRALRGAVTVADPSLRLAYFDGRELRALAVTGGGAAPARRRGAG